jgi:hypothetical protein
VLVIDGDGAGTAASDTQVVGSATLCAGAAGSATQCGSQTISVSVWTPGGDDSNALTFTY